MSFWRREFAGYILLLGAVALGFYFWRSFSSRGEWKYRRWRDFVMGTEVSVYAPQEVGEQVSGVVFGTFREVDLMMSEWKEGSPLARVNRFAGVRPVRVPKPLLELILRGIELGRVTGGAFDISWAALWGVWRFRGRDLRPPPRSQIEEKLKLVGYGQVVVDSRRGTVFLPRRGMKLGLGGIAKGYALDLSVERLRAKGFDNLLLSAGGQVYAMGRRSGRYSWRIGIQHPRRKRGVFFAVLRVSDTSVSTSGDYESYFFYRGVRYHHIIDPRTGRPSRGVSSATVICRDAALADALSTALMILKPAEGLGIISRNFPKVKVIIVDDKGEIYSNAWGEIEFDRELVRGKKLMGMVNGE